MHSVKSPKGIKLAICIALVFVGLLAIISCSDDPIAPQSKHFEAIGMYFSASGIKVLSILRGETTDTFFVPVGLSPDHIKAQFYDEDENIVDPPEDEDHWLSWEIDDPDIVEIWQHEGEEGSFEFHLRGLEEGLTHIEFFVMHIDHSDYRSGKIPILVRHEDDEHGAPFGVILKDEESGDELARAFQASNTESTTGGFQLSTGELTDHIEAVFFDDHSVEFQPSVPPHSLIVVSGDESVVTITGQESEEPWAFKLQAYSDGTTTITIYLYHDDAVGATFKTIPVHVQ